MGRYHTCPNGRVVTVTANRLSHFAVKRIEDQFNGNMGGMILPFQFSPILESIFNEWKKWVLNFPLCFVMLYKFQLEIGEPLFCCFNFYTPIPTFPLGGIHYATIPVTEWKGAPF